MAGKVDNVSDISPLKHSWRIRVRVIRLWTTPGFNLPDEVNSIEMVLLDEQGGRIHASVKRSFVRRFISVVSEGRVYDISQFGVVQNSGSYKTTQHPFKISFQYSTSIRERHDDHGIAKYGFMFSDFQDILGRVADENYLVDVIGKLDGYHEIEDFNKDGKSTKKIVTYLVDIDNRKISCTLWGEYAQQVASYLSEKNDGPAVLIIQWCKFIALFVIALFEFTKVPEQFLKDFGSELAPYILVKDPKAKCFKIRLLKSGFSGYLREGLQELKAYYGLLNTECYMNLFYVGESKFEMTVEDIYRQEVEYPDNNNVEVYDISSDSEGTNSPDLTTVVKDEPGTDTLPSPKGFSTVLTKYKANASHLNVPAAFANEIMTFSREDWKLKDDEGNQFKCHLLWSGRRENEVQLGSGWKSFCKAKNLKAGDCVKFILDEADDNTLNVSIDPK